MEYTIYCLACGSHVSAGSLETPPQFIAADVLAAALHNPGCELSHTKRHPPTVRWRVEGIVTTYTITPGDYKDAEMILE